MKQITIRSMKETDIDFFPAAFSAQGWKKPQEQFISYYNQQQRGEIRVFVAETGGSPAGYVLLLPHAAHGPFAAHGIPTIADFNVLEKCQRAGIGSRLLDAAETGVGLHSGYGPAQRLYVKRGYIPDGSGVWYQDKPLMSYTACVNDDDLVLYLSKRLR